MLRCFILLALFATPLLAQTSGEIRAGFDALATAHPDLVQIEPLVDGRPNLFAAVLRDSKTPGERPAVLILGSLRGDEAAPGAACLAMARALLADADARALLAKCEIIIIPTPNPDARDLRFARVANAVPGNLLPFDSDRDGKTDEDGPSDINGDGLITQMRVKRKGGRYVLSSHDARVLVQAAPGEQGEYDLYWEGVDDDGDGRINEDPRGQITLSNDWSIRWDDKHPGANHFMMQLTETRALATYISARRNLAAAFQIRGFGDGVKFADGPAARGDDPYQRDKEVQAELAKHWPAGKPGIPMPGEGAGNVLDWLYESQGVYAANLSLATLSPAAKADDTEEEEDSDEDSDVEEPDGPKPAKPSAAETEQMAWLAYAPADYIAWKAFAHPQLGEVEIGGWKITARLDPSTDDAAAGATRALAFVQRVANALPRLEASNVEVEDKGGGLYRVRATLHNPGAMDYRTAFSDRHDIHLPLFVSLPNEIELISGTRRQRHENLRAGATATFEWLVRVKDAEAELTFVVESERTGKLTHTVKVKDCPAIKEEE